MAVREMMDLTAHDLLESQMLDEATVPSCSPLSTNTARYTHSIYNSMNYVLISDHCF